MNKKPIVISLVAVSTIVIVATLFLGWLSLGGCPPSYWITTDVITETSEPTTNTTRSDFTSGSILQTMLIDMVDNTSLIHSNNEVPFSDWNVTKSLLEASSITPDNNNENIWSGYVYFENLLVHIQLLIMVC
ncbi:MAG: hypothetical protein ACXAC6_08215 [Candidatus Hodarchaeales archaeon]|jgi:hypothetical protein